MRIYFALNKNIIFIDEGSIIDRISKDLIGNLKTLKHNENIYPQILWLIFHNIGVDFLIKNPFVIRIPSVVIFSVSIYFFYKVSRSFFNFSVSFATLILSSFSFFLIDTSFEPRGYILGGLFIFLSVYFSSNIYLSALFFVLASACHISSFFYLPFAIYIHLVRYGKLNRSVLFFISVNVFFTFLSHVLFLIFGEKYYLSLVPESQGNLIGVFLSSIYTFSGTKLLGWFFLFLFIVGLIYANRVERLFILSGFVSYFLILFSELMNPMLQYFFVKHAFISCIFFYLGVCYGANYIASLIFGYKAKHVLLSLFVLVFTFANLSSRFLWSDYGLSSPFSPKGILERKKGELNEVVVYFDPMFITRGVGTLFFQWHIIDLDVKFFVDRNFSYFLKFNGENDILRKQWIYEDDLRKLENVKFFVFFPAALPKFYDELNSIEWWAGDYEREFYSIANLLKKYAEQKYGIEIDYSFGIFFFERYINTKNIKTEIEIIRDIVSDLFIEFVSLHHRIPKNERISSQ